MRITLVFPPSADPALPHASLPTLAACAQAERHDVVLRDLNLETFEWFFQPQALEQAILYCKKALQTSSSPESLRRVCAALEHSEEVISTVESTLQVLHDPVAFYNPKCLAASKRILKLGTQLISAPFSGIEFGKYSYSTLPSETYEDLSLATTQNGPFQSYFRETAVPSILASKPDIVGLSVSYFSQLIPAFLLAEVIREISPHVQITMGGPIITWGRSTLTRDIRFSRWFNSFFIGEAEETFPQFLAALEGHGAIEKVPNIVRYNGNRILNQVNPSYIFDLNQAPTPDYSSLPLKRYFAPARIISLTPTRGCYYNSCQFCNYSSIKLAPYRVRKPELLAQDVTGIVATTGENVFSFETDVILPADLERLSDSLISCGAQIYWHGVARLESAFTPALLAKLRRSGCIRLYFGLESASDRVLKAMNKGTNSKGMSKVLWACKQAGIGVEAGILIGFPTETLEEARETAKFIETHRAAISRVDVGPFLMLKDSPIAGKPELFGTTITSDVNRRWYVLPFSEVMTYDKLDKEEIIKEIQKIYPEQEFIDVSEDILYHASLSQERLAELSPNRLIEKVSDIKKEVEPQKHSAE